jgi:hypothetical protein
MMEFICKLILTITGWDINRPTGWSTLVSYKKKIVIYTHTSFFDFIIICLYKGIHPPIFDTLFAVNETYYNIFPSFFSWIGCIPTPVKSSNSHGGFVASIVDNLKNRDEYSFAISPEGTLAKSNWKGGYYYIARGLNDYEREKFRNSDNISRTRDGVFIIPVGLDYENHRLYIGCARDVELYQTNEEMNRSLYDDMGKMTPLYPECSFTSSSYKTPPTVVDYPLVTTWISALSCIIPLWLYNVFIAFTFTVGFCISFHYHIGKENFLLSYIVENYSAMWIVMYTAFLSSDLLLTRDVFYPLIVTSFLYYKGCGRHLSKYRSSNYVLYHSCFNIAVAFTIVYPLI